jgi:iron complex outermembrane receptor protein
MRCLIALNASTALVSLTTIAAPLWLAGAPALAQTADLEEIVVTARRSEERLQDVPAAISVLTAGAIERSGAQTTEDIVALTPGISIVTNTAEVGDTQINIRGVNGARDAESSVALVVDGVLKTNTAALNQLQSDLVQVEVLKGPQGAYYGRNAAAGAIVLTTRKPGDTLELRGKASYGNNDSYTAAVSASGPITDRAGFMVSAEYRKTDGFFRNTGPIAVAQGATVDQYEGVFVNARLLFDVTDRLSLDLKARYGKVESGTINFNVTFALPNLAAAFGSPLFNGNVNTHNFIYNSNIPSDGNQETRELSARAQWDLGFATLTGYALYSDIDQDLIADAAVAAFGFFNPAPECRASVSALFNAGYQPPPPAFLLPTPDGAVLGAFGATTCDGTQYQVRNQRDISLELRLASANQGPLSWSVGTYYLNINREVGVSLGYDRGRGITPNLFNPRNSDNPTEQLAHDRFKTDVFAVFGSADYKLLDDRLTLSAALRYDREERKVTNLVDPTARNSFVRGGGRPLNVGLDFGPLTDQKESFEQLQPKLSLAFKPVENWTIFGSWGVGFKSGGFNNQGSRATIESAFNIPAIGAGLVISDRFRKERSSAFELGARASLLDGRLRIEAAGYYTDIKDLQFFEFYAGPFGILRVVSNIDKVEIKGLEASATVQVIDGWTLFAAANVNDSEIKRNGARPGTEGGKSPYTPDYTLNFGTDIVAPLTDTIDLTFRADYRVTGPTWFSTVQDGDRPTLFRLFFGPALGTGNFEQARRDAYGVLNVRTGLKAENWSVNVFANNMLDRKFLAEVIPAPEFGGSFVSPGERRSYGIEASFRF